MEYKRLIRLAITATGVGIIIAVCLSLIASNDARALEECKTSAHIDSTIRMNKPPLAHVTQGYLQITGNFATFIAMKTGYPRPDLVNHITVFKVTHLKTGESVALLFAMDANDCNVDPSGGVVMASEDRYYRALAPWDVLVELMKEAALQPDGI